MSNSMEQDLANLSLDESKERYPPSPPANSFLIVPPEILSEILQHCTNQASLTHDAELARLCLVSHQFADVAHPLLYGTITLLLLYDAINPSDDADIRPWIEYALGPYRIIRTLRDSPRCASLVRILNVAFAKPPPTNPADREFWPVDPDDLEDSLEAAMTIMKAITELHEKSLQVLVIPQISRQPLYTHILFTELSSLECFKGALQTRLFEPQLPQKVAAQLRRLYVTDFAGPLDIKFVLSNSFDSLRYLHLCFRQKNGPVNLSFLRHLETLVITAKLLAGVVSTTGDSILDFATACRTWIDLPNKLISSVLETFSSARSIRTLEHLSLLTNVHQFLAPHFETFFLRLPPSIVVFSLPDSWECHPLPWSILIANHRRLYPYLTKIVLRRPENSVMIDHYDAKTYFGIDDFEARTGIKIEWIPNVDDAWIYWTEKQFYEKGSRDQLMGRGNEFARRQDELERTTYVVG
ncbi:uncharacterized protein JCM6883_007183 [Sporobolomyces salmoneus]|uniref:uncharacterized protein n=1 Tax=Sporobolomyces salmoneus TaxID=183962 RepID=UPI0031759734